MKKGAKHTGRDRRLKSKPCIYCGRTPAGSVDHVPPACFFPDPKPHNLLTVPSCEDCNVGFSMDDVYARDMILLRHDVCEQERLQPLIEAMHQHFAKPSNRKYLAMVVAGLQQGKVRMEHSGVVVPNQHFYTPDRKRLLRWLERVTRGLHYAERRYRVPDDFAVTAGLGMENQEVLAQFAVWMRGLPRIDKAGGIFRYKWFPVPDRPDVSAWGMSFYGRASFVAFVGPKAELPRVDVTKSRGGRLRVYLGSEINPVDPDWIPAEKES